MGYKELPVSFPGKICLVSRYFLSHFPVKSVSFPSINLSHFTVDTVSFPGISQEEKSVSFHGMQWLKSVSFHGILFRRLNVKQRYLPSSRIKSKNHYILSWFPSNYKRAKPSMFSGGCKLLGPLLEREHLSGGSLSRRAIRLGKPEFTILAKREALNQRFKIE